MSKGEVSFFVSTVEKLKNRLLSKPKDFTYDEAKRLLESFGFSENNKGKTSGSRVIFFRKSDEKIFYLHRPHPQNTLKLYVIKALIDFINELSFENEELDYE